MRPPEHWPGFTGLGFEGIGVPCRACSLVALGLLSQEACDILRPPREHLLFTSACPPSEEKACDGPRPRTPVPHLKEGEAARRPGSAESTLPPGALGSVLFQSTCCSPAQPRKWQKSGQTVEERSSILPRGAGALGPASHGHRLCPAQQRGPGHLPSTPTHSPEPCSLLSGLGCWKGHPAVGEQSCLPVDGPGTEVTGKARGGRWEGTRNCSGTWSQSLQEVSGLLQEPQAQSHLHCR